MRKEANFSNIITEIVTKSMRKERNDVMVGVRKNQNFGNKVTEILATQMKCPKERSAQKEKINCGN